MWSDIYKIELTTSDVYPQCNSISESVRLLFGLFHLLCLSGLISRIIRLTPEEQKWNLILHLCGIIPPTGVATGFGLRINYIYKDEI